MLRSSTAVLAFLVSSLAADGVLLAAAPEISVARPAPRVVQGALPPAPCPLDEELGEPAPLLPVQLLEDVPGKGAGKSGLPLLRLLPPSDPRVAQAERLLDNEAARFVLRLLHRIRAEVAEGADLPALPIVLRPGGNHARTGYRLATGRAAPLEFPERPYVALELRADRLSHTLLHEGAHVVHRLCQPRGAAEAAWSAVPHSTFAVTDPATALSEGYAIHLETLWGHFGADPDRRAFYHHLAPAFGAEAGLGAEFFWPVRDLLSFSQNWARYQAVRDGTPAFSGVVRPGDYLRSQYDPARDFSELRPANGQISCEGNVASVLFWVAGAWAGVKEGGGLDQDGLVQAETALARALGLACKRNTTAFRPDVVDVIAACGPSSSARARQAIEIFVGITRGITARPELRARWRGLYASALGADFGASRPALEVLDAARRELVTRALADPSVLRSGLGPVVPVRAEGPELGIAGLGMKFAREFDLNAATRAELALLRPAGRMRATSILAERDRRPFASLADFEQRTGIAAAAAGLTLVR